jgi:hypothetical protein
VANLLPRAAGARPFSVLDPERLRRFRGRLARVRSSGLDSVSLAASRAGAPPEAEGPDLDALLEELETSPSVPGLESLLEEIDHRLRPARDGSEATVPSRSQAWTASDGGFICYRPGRALETGEAGLASRGFFDGLDRPPLALWLAAIARPQGSRGFEVAVVAWVPPSELARARRGRDACRSGALAWLSEVSPELEAQLGPCLRADDRSD